MTRILTERLILSEITWKDLENIHWLHSIPEVDEFNTLGIPEDIEETRRIMSTTIADQAEERRNEYQWTIIQAKENKFIGLAGMRVYEARFKMA